jgi:D-3-phosphoglycerate dehydrogenase / 2-oxoglutarate reductase
MKPVKNCRVLVTANSYGKYNRELKDELERLVGEVVYNTTGKPLSSEQVSVLLPGIDGYIAGLDQIDQHALQFADSLKIIARYGVGVDQVDLEAAKEKGIIVSNTPGANSASVAELAVGMLLMLARQIPAATSAIQRGEWPRLPGLTLEGKTVGILGLGAIGKHFARRMANFDCRLIAHDPYADEAFVRNHNIELVPLEELISQSDFISLHLPVLPETRGMVNDAFIQSMKKGAFLINTSRGELIDEDALVRGLASGHLQGAGLDAFIKEPPDIDNPLLAFPQVICTPHLGAQTDGATNNMGRMALDECLRVLRGEEPHYQVN